MEEKVNLREKLNEGYVRAVLIIEVLGKPAEYVTSALKTILGAMKKDKALIVYDQKFYDPKQVEKFPSFYTAFIEVELLANNFRKLMEVCFDYMPSSLEVMEPPELKLNINDANLVINDLASRLHKYDEITKKLNLEKQALQRKVEGSDSKKEAEINEEKEK